MHTTVLMMKRALLFIFLTALGLAVTAGPASAEVIQFDLYTVDVPAGWNIINKNDIVTLISPDQRNIFFITRGLSASRHKEKIAPAAAKYNHIIKQYPKQNVTAMPVREKRIAVTMLGDHPDRTKIYYSIKEVAVASEF